MYVPTSRSKKRVYVSVLDVLWALASPMLALYVGGALVLMQENWSVVATYCAISSAVTTAVSSVELT